MGTIRSVGLSFFRNFASPAPFIGYPESPVGYVPMAVGYDRYIQSRFKIKANVGDVSVTAYEASAELTTMPLGGNGNWSFPLVPYKTDITTYGTFSNSFANRPSGFYFNVCYVETRGSDTFVYVTEWSNSDNKLWLVEINLTNMSSRHTYLPDVAASDNGGGVAMSPTTLLITQTVVISGKQKRAYLYSADWVNMTFTLLQGPIITGSGSSGFGSWWNISTVSPRPGIVVAQLDNNNFVSYILDPGGVSFSTTYVNNMGTIGGAYYNANMQRIDNTHVITSAGDSSSLSIIKVTDQGIMSLVGSSGAINTYGYSFSTAMCGLPYEFNGFAVFNGYDHTYYKYSYNQATQAIAYSNTVSDSKIGGLYTGAHWSGFGHYYDIYNYDAWSVLEAENIGAAEAVILRGH